MRRIQSTDRWVGDGMLSRAERNLALSIGGVFRFGVGVHGVVTPAEDSSLQEPSLVVRLVEKSGLPDPPPTRTSALEALCELVTDADIAGDPEAAAKHIVWIADRCGQLALCSHLLPFSHDPRCTAIGIEPVRAWTAWAAMFHAALTGQRVPDVARDLLDLVWLQFDPTAFELIDWLGQGHGLKALGPTRFVPQPGGLFHRLHGELCSRLSGEEERATARCSECGAPIPSRSRKKGARSCPGRCKLARKARQTKHRRAQRRKGQYMLRCILAFYGEDSDGSRTLLKALAAQVDRSSPAGPDDSYFSLIARAAKRVEKLHQFSLPGDRSLNRFHEKGYLD